MPKTVNINGVGKVNFPDNMSDDEIAKAIETDILPNAKVSTPQVDQQKTQASLTDRLLRQAGLTARIGVEALGDLGSGAMNLMHSAVDTNSALRNKIGQQNGNPFEGSGERAADTLGLPKPANSVERVVNTTGRLVVPTAIGIGAANSASRLATSPSAKALFDTVAADPLAQLSAAAGSGLSGGAARESGATPTGEFLASLAGGVAAPYLTRGFGAGAQALSTPSNVDARVDASLKNAIPEFDSLPAEIQSTLRQDVQKALKTNGNLSTDALRRLADYRRIGSTPMRSSLTLNPADVTRDQNLVKMSANSSDPAAQQLSNIRGENQKKILDFINKAGAEKAIPRDEAGSVLINQLKNVDDTASAALNNLYTQARSTGGRSANIDPSAFTQKANDLLDDALLGGKLSGDVRNKLNSFATGKTPLTVDTAEQFKTNIASLQRASNDPAERLALAKVREALDDAPLLDGQGERAVAAFNKARNAYRKYMTLVDNTPALKAVRDGVAPDQFVNNYIIGPKSTIKDLGYLKGIVKDSPEALDTIRSQILQHLKLRGTSGAADEVASFSPSKYNNELKKISDSKLSVFFSRDEIDSLKALGRVASYEKFQPTGSAVNNSNTAATLFMNALERLGASGLLRKVPFGNIVSNQANDIALGNSARSTLNPSKSIVTPPIAPKKPIPALGLGIGALAPTTE